MPINEFLKIEARKQKSEKEIQLNRDIVSRSCQVGGSIVHACVLVPVSGHATRDTAALLGQLPDVNNKTRSTEKSINLQLVSNWPIRGSQHPA